MNLTNRAEMREQNGSQLPNGKSNSFHNHIQLNCQLCRLIFPLLHERIPRQTLAAWAVEAGYSKGYVASLLSRVLVSLGLRERNKGAGRKPSLAALELLAHARSQYGEDFLKVMRAAWRAGKAQLAPAITLNETSERTCNLIVAPQLDETPDSRHTKQRELVSHRNHLFKRTCKPAAEINSKKRKII